MVWLHGMLHVEIHEARHLPRDRIIRLPDSVSASTYRRTNVDKHFDLDGIVACRHTRFLHLCNSKCQLSGSCHHVFDTPQARHKLKPLDKLIGATEKLAVGERASNPYVVISVGQSHPGRILRLSNSFQYPYDHRL